MAATRSTKPRPVLSFIQSSARRLGLRPAARGRRSWLDVVCVAWLAWLFDWINDLPPVRQRLAERHAADVLDLERSLHIAPEHALNVWAASHSWVSHALVAWYEDAHLYITFGMFAWVWWRRPDLLSALRISFFAVNAVALVVFSTYPVAPPRMLPADGFRDLNAIVDGYRPWRGGAVSLDSNQLASLPSLHVALAVIVTLALLWATRRTAVRVAAVVYPFITTLAVMGTANHFLADAVTGASAGVLIGLGAQRIVTRRRAPRPVTQA